MIHRLPARARGRDEDGEVALGSLLPDELGEAARAQGGVRIAGLAGGGVEGVSHNSVRSLIKREWWSTRTIKTPVPAMR